MVVTLLLLLKLEAARAAIGADRRLVELMKP